MKSISDIQRYTPPTIIDSSNSKPRQDQGESWMRELAGANQGANSFDPIFQSRKHTLTKNEVAPPEKHFKKLIIDEKKIDEVDSQIESIKS